MGAAKVVAPLLAAGLLFGGGAAYVSAAGAATDAAANSNQQACIDNAGAGVQLQPDAARDRNASTYIEQGRAMGIPARGIVTSLATILVESDGLNLASRAVPESMKYPHDKDVARYGADGVPPGDHDSIGTAQQRVVGFFWWPTVEQGMKVDVQARAFFNRLQQIPGWQVMSVGGAAQAVQVSAHPERYAAREADATELYNRLSGSVPDVVIAPAVDTSGCGTPDIINAGNAVVSGEWANPLKPAPYIIVSHYGPRRLFGATFHKGEDLAAPIGTPVHAVCKGKVIGAGWVEGGGGNEVRLDCGGGVQVKLMHNSSIVTTVGADVDAGEVVSLVGSTGNSTGPHSHVQVEVNGQHVPPLPFFKARGVPL